MTVSADRPDPEGLHRLVELGASIEARRRQLAKSAREVAQAAGISPVYLRVIETGRNSKTGRASRPSAEVLVRLAHELELAPDELLMRAGYESLRADEHQSARVPEPHTPLPEDVRRIAEALELAQTRPSDFMRQFAAAEVARFQAQLTAIASGSLVCEATDEPRLRRLALLTACHRSLHAVSFEDDAWWLGSQGAGHLALHARLAATRPAPTLTRIFLLGASDRERYGDVLVQQSAAGVEVFVADPIDVPRTCRRDFEIYDGSLLREANSSGHEAAGRDAEFTDDHARLQRAEAAFAAAREVAVPMPAQG